MNEGDSAGRRRNSTSPPAVADRRSTQILGIASAAPVSQMSQLPASRLSVQSSESQNTNDSCNSGSSNNIITGSTTNSVCVKSNIGSGGGGNVSGNTNVLRSQHVHVTATTTSTTSSANNGNGTNDLVSTTRSPLYASTTVSVSNVGHTSVAQTPSATTTTTASTTTTTFIGCNSGQLATIAKKRSANNTDADSIINYKKRNYNHRAARLKQIKDNYTDHVAEIYYLQIGGNMMDYFVWRKKANTPDFLNFMKQRRLDAPSADTAGTTTTTTITTATASAPIATATLPAGRSTKVYHCGDHNSYHT